MPRTPERHVIGAILVDLVKSLRKLERTSGRALPVSAAARATLDRRVLISEWVSLDVFLELLHALDALVLKGDEQRAMELGALGGASMRGLQKAYVVVGDPLSSVAAMRHAWRAHYDFGRLSCDTTNEAVVRFTVSGYPDMTMVHGMMTVGWGVAAARAAGAAAVRAEILERPWRGATTLTYDVQVRGRPSLPS